MPKLNSSSSSLGCCTSSRSAQLWMGNFLQRFASKVDDNIDNDNNDWVIAIYAISQAISSLSSGLRQRDHDSPKAISTESAQQRGVMGSKTRMTKAVLIQDFIHIFRSQSRALNLLYFVLFSLVLLLSGIWLDFIILNRSHTFQTVVSLSRSFAVKVLCTLGLVIIRSNISSFTEP